MYTAVELDKELQVHCPKLGSATLGSAKWMRYFSNFQLKKGHLSIFHQIDVNLS